MKYLNVLIVAAAVVTVGPLTRAQTPSKPAPSSPTRAAAEKVIAANETKIDQAFAKGDVATMKTMIADDAVAMDAGGATGVADMFKMIATANMKITDVALTNLKYVWADDNTAVLTYTLTGKGTMDGQPVPSPVYASTVWTKRGGKWIAVFHQETIAAPVPPKK